MFYQFIIIGILEITALHQVAAFDPLVGNINTFLDLIEDSTTGSSSETSLVEAIVNDPEKSLDLIISNMITVSDELTQLYADNSQQNMSALMESLLYVIPLGDELKTMIVDIQTNMTCINDMYHKYFTYYITNSSTINNETTSEFIEQATADNGEKNFQTILKYIYNSVMPKNDMEDSQSILDSIRKANENMPEEEQCESDVSHQQRLYEIYNALVITEAKGFIMTIFSYAMLTAKENVSYSNKMDEASAGLILRVEEYLLATQKAMNNTDMRFRRCDPSKQERGETFVELEGAIQMFIAHEPDLFGDGGCYAECKYIKISTVYGCYDSNNWCPHRTCNGIVSHCSSSGWTRICELPVDSVRRYDWVRDKYGYSYGKENICRGTYRSIDSWTSVIVKCDVCMCNCYEEKGASTAIRTINLRPQLSNVHANMVVTGLKFISADKMIQIQIKEGELLPGGRIKQNTEQWVEPEKFIYDPKDDYGGGFSLIAKNNTVIKLTNSEDYSFIHYRQRAMDLDDIKVPSGYVITGIKFKHEYTGKPDTWYESRIWITVHATKFDFNSGIFSSDENSSIWVTPYSQENPSWPYRHGRYEIKPSGYDNPENAKISIPRGPANRFIEFRSTSRFTDVGQSTIPFFDAQGVERSISVALNGIGLFHKQSDPYGGFLAFRTMNIDFFEYLNTRLSEDVVDKYKDNFSDSLPYDIK